MYLFKIDDEVRLYNRPLGKVPVLSDAVLLAKIWKPRERAGKERSTPSMRRPVSVKVFLSFLFFPFPRVVPIQPSRLCRHPSIRTLL